jgi:hypothetical protein
MFSSPLLTVAATSNTNRLQTQRANMAHEKPVRDVRPQNAGRLRQNVWGVLPPASQITQCTEEYGEVAARRASGRDAAQGGDGENMDVVSW